MKTILALIDFSDVSAKILDHAEEHAKAFGGDVVLIHVVPPEPLVVDFEPPAVPPDVFKTRQKELFVMRDTLIEHGVQATAQLYGGLLLETVLDQIASLDPDVIIMGSHGHGALYHLIVGSVTEGVIKHASRPVLVIPSVPVPKTHLVKAAVKKARRGAMGEAIGVLGGMPLPP
ncbi:MAG: universal stress protein [Prosthecobacter sp.]|uniref:universal stress protein n=1 Tax=Prosthecobacter sp. TaxID=1965333 RepID=UPI0025FD3964|nr:universal stress protein [Prosthecobacter sp.]MCF7787182.1 universal stress protein [Prosthecobacter sp.]